MFNFKKIILYSFLLFLIINCNILIIHGATTTSSSSSSTTEATSKPVTPAPSNNSSSAPTSKPTSSSSEVKPTTSSDSSTAISSSTSTSESSEELHKCATDFYSNFGSAAGFDIGESSSENDPYKCALAKSNVVFSSSSKSSTSTYARLSIDSTGCPSKCLSHSYSCSEISTTTDTSLSYGTFEFTVAASPVKNVYTKVYISSGGKSQYSDIYFLINGNTTKLNYGYTYFGQTIPFSDTLTGTDFSLEQKYKFIYTSGKLSFYYNNKLLQSKVESSIYNGIKLPQPPMKFYFSVTSNDNEKIPTTGLPTYSQISSFNYTSEMCSSDSDSDGENNWNSNQDSPMYFFTSNCTNYRPIPIFNDSFNDGWEDDSRCLVQYPNSTNNMAQFARIGTSIGFALNSIENYFLIRSNQSIPITRHKYIMFWINGGTKGRQSVALYLISSSGTKIGSINIGDYIHGSLEPYTWYKVVIPTRKIIINPVTAKTFNAFMIQGTSDTFLDMIYLDDFFFSNGTICLDQASEKPYYNRGTLLNGASGQYSVNNVNFNSTSKLFRGFKTIEYQVEVQNTATISFMNGTINTGEMDLMKLNFFFVPDPLYNNNNNQNDFSEDNDLAGSSFILKLKICANVLTVGDLPCVGLSEYLGGQVLANKWVELLIPFSDLQIYPNALIQFLSFKTNDDQHEGAFFIGDLQFGKFVPPHVDEPEESLSIKLSINLCLFISLLIIILIL